ncbi:MAG TPA: RES domain-containing protein [Opitutaceae bacterium]|nr:RES domain-containing protein [Opitutaceae bacterium]
MPWRKAGRGQPRVPPSSAEFAKCKPDLLTSYSLHWMRLAVKAHPALHDWDDRAVSRFSNPTHPFKILYLADEKETAFWEVFGADIEDMPIDNRALYAKAQLQPREWIRFEVPSGLRLIDVSNETTMHALRSNAGTWLAPYKHCQAWAKALMDHPLKLDGFIYQACRRGETARCLALFSRPDVATMENLLLARTASGRPSIESDPDILRFLIKNEIDLR